MALNIIKTTPYAVDIQYFRLGIVNNHPISKSCDVVLFGYISKELRDGGAIPITKFEICVPYADVKSGSLADIYCALKNMPEWADATDC